MEYFLHFSVLQQAILVEAPLFGRNDSVCPYYPATTESNKSFCSQAARQARAQCPYIATNIPTIFLILDLFQK